MTTSRQLIIVLALLSILATVSFLIPFFTFHHGLPTGDSQKSILWAQRFLATGRLPDYQESITFLNRDPVDFYTPALHLLTAVYLSLGNLTAVGVSAILFAVAVALMGAAIAYHVLPLPSRYLGAVLTFILILTQERFLRYLREPGYHYQNIVGELLLFTLLLLGLYLIERWRWSVFSVACILLLILAFSHQFSMFLAAFTVLPLFIALAIKYRHLVIVAAPIILIAAVGGAALGLHEKIPHIFTSTPHLLSQTPTLGRALQLMGIPWAVLGLSGVALLLKHTTKNLRHAAFLGCVAVLLVLSQGPRLGIDIPPVRALLYLAVPLSITGAFFLTQLWQTASILKPFSLSRFAKVSLLILLGLLVGSSVSRAFTLSHSIRTNSTLTPGQLELIQHLASQPGSGVLVDDYNRRSASWLVLAGHPMYTRIASDLATQMREAKQSELRYQLYLNQLDFEKIFSLGSRPEIVELMEKHGITWLTGIDGSSVSHFRNNPALVEVKKVDDITLFKANEATSYQLTSWLLKPSTLANDIGDLEDTHIHLPVSLRATRVSDHEVSNNITFRTTTAPQIPLKFNVGNYVAVLWDQDNTSIPDASLELLIRFKDVPSSLTLTTSTGTTLPLSPDQLIKINASDAPIDETGFITLTVNNPQELPLAFDIIALGLAHTP